MRSGINFVQFRYAAAVIADYKCKLADSKARQWSKIADLIIICNCTTEN